MKIIRVTQTIVIEAAAIVPESMPVGTITGEQLEALKKELQVEAESLGKPGVSVVVREFDCTAEVVEV